MASSAAAFSACFLHAPGCLRLTCNLEDSLRAEGGDCKTSLPVPTVFVVTSSGEGGNTCYQPRAGALPIWQGCGTERMGRHDRRAGDDMLDDFRTLFIAHCVGHSNFHCSFPLEFLRLGNSSFKVSFLKTETGLLLTVFGRLG